MDRETNKDIYVIYSSFLMNFLPLAQSEVLNQPSGPT
jgi:hypothetical protein